MHNLTQEDLAVRVGVTRQTINVIENRRYTPSLELVLSSVLDDEDMKR
jgi:putative transcriptional regulator